MEIEDKTQQDVGNDGGDDELEDNANTDLDDDDGDDDGASDGAGDGSDDGDSGESQSEYIERILDEHGLDSAEELKDFIDDLAGLKGQIGDQDLEELIENSKTLKEFQEHWAKQEAEKLKENETPEETIARLEREKEEIVNKRKSEANQKKQRAAAQRALEEFNDTVQSTIRTNKSIPAEYRDFFAEFMGVNNPINDVSIDDKAAVRRLTKAAVKKMQNFEQAVIKRYLDGKSSVPKVSKSETTQSDTGKKPKVKNLNDARKQLFKNLGLTKR